ncbi:MAG TPA: ankyrin repeat domain-containing protein [Longimicrobiales bacterium]|nr:ankyrin repeat domain-containing protein [Longimicrobiales bacterium]
MATRILPVRPNLDHLKNEAKLLRREFARADASAVQRVHAVLPLATSLKLTEAQRVIAREYGFPTWPRLRAHVDAMRSVDDAVESVLTELVRQNLPAARAILKAEPRIASTSLHVAAVLGRNEDVSRLIREDPGQVRARRGPPGGDPLLWLCYSPFHGDHSTRADFAACMRALLDAGADPNTAPAGGGPPALYGVTGLNDEPGLARMLLEAGANATDGESLHHAAERFHEECLRLLLEFGADLDATGDWGNTPLYFLIRYWDLTDSPAAMKGVGWLLEHGADPDVRCGSERETALHAAVRRGQDAALIELLIEHGADVHARRGDGRSAWLIAARSGHGGLAALLEFAGAEPERLDAAAELLAACGRGDADLARRLTAPSLIATLDDADLNMVREAAGRGAVDVVRACLAAGFPVNAADEHGATALHLAAIGGHAAIVRELLRAGADHGAHDHEHDSPPLGWAFYGTDFIAAPGADYTDTVRALLEAGARPEQGHDVANAGVRTVLKEYDVVGFV